MALKPREPKLNNPDKSTRPQPVRLGISVTVLDELLNGVNSGLSAETDAVLVKKPVNRLAMACISTVEDAPGASMPSAMSVLD
jgi:hypothetical protein